MTVRRLLASLAGLALPALALVLGLAQAEAELRAGVPLLPERAGGFSRIASDELAKEVVAKLAPFDYAMGAYADGPGTTLWAYVARYAGWGQVGAHAPEACYPAQGWDISSAERVIVRVSGGDGDAVLTAQMFTATRGTEREAVLWWFQPAGRWPRSEVAEQALRVFDTVAGRPQYAFVRLSIPMSGSDDAALPGDARARRQLVALAEALAAHVRSALQTGDGRSGDGRLGDGRSGDGRSGDGRSGDGRSGDGRLGDGRLGDGRSGDGRLGDGGAGALSPGY